jgi:tetratricopeptide (TPR) repeat protein
MATDSGTSTKTLVVSPIVSILGLSSSGNRISQFVHHPPGLFLAFLILSLLGAFSLHKVTNVDIGWHIKAGEYIVTNRTVPGLDIFSYTATDRPYIDSHWLFQVVVYIVYALLGVYGLNLLIVLIAGTVFIILFRCVGFLGEPYIASYFFLLAILAGSDRFMIRPELFTFLFIAIYLYILHKHRDGRELYLLPLLQILWVNMHGLFVLGPVMVLCYIIGGLATWKLKLPFEWNREGALDRKRFLRLARVFGLLVLATFINPYGYRLAFYPVTLFIEVSQVENIVGASVVELIPPFSIGHLLNMEFLMFYKLLFVSSLLTFFLNYRRVNLSHLLLYTAFFYLSTLAVRNITLFAIVAVPFAVFNVEGFLTELRVFKGSSFETVLKYVASVVLVLVVGYYLASLYSNDYYLRKGRFMRTGLGLSEVRYPKGAIDFVQRNGIKGNVFNSPGFGGYLRYGVNYALIKSFSRLSVFLYKDPAWKLVYCDEVAVVFVKNTAENQKAIDNARCDLENETTQDVGAIKRSYLERIDEGFLARTIRLARLFSEGYDPLTHLNRGAFYNIMGLVNRAEEEHLRSLAMFPHQKMAHNNLGVAYYDLGRFAEAIEEFKRAIKLNPGFAMAHNNLGNVYNNLGRTDEAIEEYREAIRLKPDFADAHNNLGLVYYNQGQTDKAIEELMLVLRIKPDLPEAHNNLGNSYYEQGRMDEAIEEYKEAIRLRPDYPEAHNNLGLVYNNLGRTDKAIEEFKKAISLKPDFAEAHNNLGYAFDSQGRRDDAIEEYKEAIRHKPDFAEAHNNLGTAYGKKGLFDMAVEEFLTALRLEPDSVEVHFNLGIAYKEMGLKEEAIREFEQLIEINPRDRET